jgi:hypothetical protein
LIGGSNDLPRSNGSEPPRDQNLKSHVVRPTGLWIRLTWNLWYPLWYPVQPHVAPNLPPSRKSLLYPIYIVERMLMPMYEFFARPFRPMGRRMMQISYVYFVLLFTMSYPKSDFFNESPSNLKIGGVKGYSL